MKAQTKWLIFISSCAAYFIFWGDFEYLGYAFPFVFAHCDTMKGPVIAEARKALHSGDIFPLLKWIRQEDEAEVREAFAKTLSARTLSPEATEFVDRYFFETLVRIHRAGEGAPYTGLKDEEVDSAVALADKALENGDVNKLVDVLTGAMESGIRERFVEALENRQAADDSVSAGREFIRSYVSFTHYVEGLHGLIKGKVTSHDEGAHGH